MVSRPIHQRPLTRSSTYVATYLPLFLNPPTAVVSTSPCPYISKIQRQPLLRYTSATGAWRPLNSPVTSFCYLLSTLHLALALVFYRIQGDQTCDEPLKRRRQSHAQYQNAARKNRSTVLPMLRIYQQLVLPPSKRWLQWIFIPSKTLLPLASRYMFEELARIVCEG